MIHEGRSWSRDDGLGVAAAVAWSLAPAAGGGVHLVDAFPLELVVEDARCKGLELCGTPERRGGKGSTY